MKRNKNIGKVFHGSNSLQSKRDGRIVNRVAYLILGITLEGTKDSLSIAIGADGSYKFLVQMHNDLKKRGVKDGLKGFKKTINAVSPGAEVQCYIIHMAL